MWRKICKTHLLKSSTGKGCPLLPLLFKIILVPLVCSVIQEKNSKVYRSQANKYIFVSLFANCAILFIENLNVCMEKLLEILTSQQVTRNKLNTQKKISYFYTYTTNSKCDLKNIYSSNKNITGTIVHMHKNFTQKSYKVITV